jgi:hypothetical protein
MTRRAESLLCRWDLDKTYLRSEFETLRQLLRTAWERGEDKIEVPGVPEVLKALKASSERARRSLAVHFISASPPQIGKAIRDKLALDGVPYDGIVFKDQLRHIRRGKFRNLREHVGFKLRELMRGRLAIDASPDELLFGDDWESDPLTYSAYADVVAGLLRGRELEAFLVRIGVDRAAVPELLALAEQIQPAPQAVRRIFINLARRTPPAKLQAFGPRLVPTFNYFQTAVVLAADGVLDRTGVTDVARALADRATYTPAQLDNSLADLIRRGCVSEWTAQSLVRPLRREGLLPARSRRPRWRRRLQRWVRRRRADGAAERRALDYEAILTRLPHLTRTGAERVDAEEVRAT